MFWPVTTGRGGDLCNSPGSTITASPTGPPNSFVTEGITITSPTVAISLGFMSRVDGCGTTINHTIIPVHPDQVTSVRGFRALFEHHQFNFADLNYFCMDSNKTMATIPEGEGDSCYQQVPADAYFGGLNNAAVLDQAPFRNLTKEQMTIWDDYQPQLLPPATLTVAIASLWGNDCNIHPDGVWDPPIALTPEAAIVVPTAPGGGGASETSAESNASPINSYQAQPPRQTGIAVPTQPSQGDSQSSSEQHFTSLPETGGYGGGGGSSGGQSGQQEGSDSGSNGGGSSGGQSGAGSNSGSQGGSSGSGSGSNGSGQSSGSGSGQQDGSNGSGSSSSGSGSGQQQGSSSGGPSGGSSSGSSSGQDATSGNSGSGSSGDSSNAMGNGQSGSEGSAGYGSNGESSGSSSSSGGSSASGGSSSGSNGESNSGSNGNGQNTNSGSDSASNQGQADGGAASGSSGSASNQGQGGAESNSGSNGNGQNSTPETAQTHRTKGKAVP